MSGGQGIFPGESDRAPTGKSERAPTGKSERTPTELDAGLHAAPFGTKITALLSEQPGADAPSTRIASLRGLVSLASLRGVLENIT